jgi:hypothetical protein
MFNKTVTLVSSVFPSTVMFEVPWRLLQALQFDNGICLIETAFRLSVFPTQWLAARVIYCIILRVAFHDGGLCVISYMHINAHNHIVTLLIRILITHQLVGKHTSSSHHSSATEYSMIIRYNCRMVIPYVARYRLSIIPTAERPLIFGGIRSSFSCSSQRIHSEQIIRDLFLSSNTLSTYGWGGGGRRARK